MDIQYRGTYSPADLSRISKISARRFAGQTFLHQIGCSTLTGIALIVVPLISYFRSAPPTVLTWIPLGFLALGLSAVNEWGSRREFKRHPLANRTVSGNFTSDGFSLNTDRSESRIDWSAFSDYACTGGFLFLTDSINVFALPKSFFITETDFASAFQLASSAIARRSKPFLNWRRLFTVITWVVLMITVFLLWSLFQTTNSPEGPAREGRPTPHSS